MWIRWIRIRIRIRNTAKKNMFFFFLKLSFTRSSHRMYKAGILILNETLRFSYSCQSQMPIMSVIRAIPVLLCQKEEEVQKVRPANTCFNCLGDHMMNDCPEPRDQRKIIKNRKEFQSKTAGFNSARWDECSLKINLHQSL
jgi:hypothetical protein